LNTKISKAVMKAGNEVMPLTRVADAYILCGQHRELVVF
jgi:hypothetical protein